VVLAYNRKMFGGVAGSFLPKIEIKEDKPRQGVALHKAPFTPRTPFVPNLLSKGCFQLNKVNLLGV
jgi:hypothetical protein